MAEIFPEIIRRIKPPVGQPITTPARMLLFDSWFDQHRGVITLFKMVDGELKLGVQLICISFFFAIHLWCLGDYIASYHTGNKYEVAEIGLLMPHKYPIQCKDVWESFIRVEVCLSSLPALKCGQVGYVVAGIKNSREVRPGIVLCVCALFPRIKINYLSG